MASPFHSFRRHQKKFLAFLCVALMIAFVFTGITCDPRMGGDSVVARTNFGNIYQSKLAELRTARNISNNFVARLVGRQPYFGSADDESLLDSYLMAHKARQLGMVVSDQAILDFIDDLAASFIGLPSMPREMVQGALSATNVSQAQLFAALRIELQSRWLMQQYFSPNFEVALSPGERWRLFERIYRQVDAQVLAVPVSSFLAQVKDPGDAVLRDFFARYKDREANPDFPEPGFRQPQRANLQYVVADFTAVLEEAKGTITEEEIRAYYDENQQLFPWTGFQEAAPTEDPRGESAAPAPENSNSSGATPGSGANTPAPANEPSNSNKPSPNEGAGLNSEKEFFPVAFQVGDDAAPADDPVAKPGSATEPAAPSPGSSPAAAGDQKPVVDPAPGPATAGGNNPPASGGASSDEPTESPAMPDREPLQEFIREYLVIPKNILAGPEPQYEPLWKVEQNVRDELARKRAEEWILNGREGQQIGLREIRSQLVKLGNDWRDISIRFDQDADQLAASRKDLENQAAQIAQAAIRVPYLQLQPPTASLTLRELIEDTELGKSNLVSNTAGGPTPANVGFGDSFVRANLFEPDISQSTEAHRNVFLFWKVDERLPYTPEKMEDVRDQVLTAWKMIEARKLALNEAQRLEAEAKKDMKPLTEVQFAGESGVNLPPISWMRQSFNQFTGQLGMEWVPLPEEVKVAGLDLRKTLFNMNEGDYATAFNQPQTIAYVMHATGTSYSMTGRQFSPESIRAIFMAEPFRSYAEAMQIERFDSRREFFNELRREYDLEILTELRGSNM